MEQTRRQFLQGLATISGVFVAQTSATANNLASRVNVQKIRLSEKSNYVRLVLETNKQTEHSIFTLHNPERVVLDIKNTQMTQSVLEQLQANDLIVGVRRGVKNNHDLRVVFDLKSAVSPRSFLLTPNKSSAHRLVIDLHVKNKVVKTQALKQSKKRDVIIAIDAGHGGKDPGATGRLGTKEKKITLQIAKQLKKQIDNERGMTAVLIRKADYSMRLRQRIEKARKYRADMMISIHADSFPNPRVQGSSVYALSVRGATSETARMLAEKENAADILFGDVNLAVEDKMVKEVLFDLSLTGTIESSLDIGDEVLKQIKSVNSVHKKKVQQAGFAVLKAPNIPSILLETAFISNPREEKKLRSSAHQQKVAKAIARGVSKYFVRKAPPGTWLSAVKTNYAVNQGDTLSSIAKKHHVSNHDLRARNALYSDHLINGQILQIPVS